MPKNKSENKSKGLTADSGENIVFEDFVRVKPALDFVNGEMLVTIPLPYDRPIVDKDGNIKGTEPAIDNFVLTSSRRVFRCTGAQFTKAKMIAQIPETILEQRVSLACVKAFLEGKKTVEPYIVYRELKGTRDYFMDYSNVPGASVALTLYDVLSYCYPLFSAISYFRLTGDKGAAKTKEGQFSEQVAFNPLNAVSYTGPSLFRTVQDTRGMQIIDEAETYGRGRRLVNSERQEDLNQLSNSGHQDSGKVTRIETDGKRRVRRTYSTYSPKKFCSINSVTETLRDRSYELTLIKTQDRSKSRRQVRSSDPRWQALRDSLYLLMLNYWQEIKQIIEKGEIENRLDLAGREWDKAYPLLVLAKFFDNHYPEADGQIVADLWNFIEYQHEKESEIQLGTLDLEVVSVLEAMITDEVRRNPPLGVDIDPLVKLKLLDLAQTVGLSLGVTSSSAFNVESYSKLIKGRLQNMALANNFRRGTGNRTYFDTSMSKVRDARTRYNIPESQEETQNNGNYDNSLPLDNFANLLNSSPEIFKKLVTMIDGNSWVTIFGDRNIGEKLSKLLKLPLLRPNDETEELLDELIEDYNKQEADRQ